MKWLSFLFMGICLPVCTTGVFAQMKIGYVNSQEILAELPEVKQAEANLKSLEQQLQRKGQKMIEELQKKYQDLERKQKQGLIAPKQLEEEAQKLEQEKLKIAQFEQEMRDQLLKKQQELMAPVLEKVQKAIEVVAKENGYTYILDATAGVLYADPKYDVSNLVREKLRTGGN